MFSLRHPNCVQLMGTCLAPPCLITEYCSRGSLADCLREARRHPAAAAELPWHRRLAMVGGGSMVVWAQACLLGGWWCGVAGWLTAADE
jgi:hypothetical protein